MGLEIFISVLVTIATCLIGIGVKVLASVYKKMGEIEAKLDGKLNAEDCKERQRNCRGGICEDIRDLWAAFNNHSHTGLEPNAKVTR